MIEPATICKKIYETPKYIVRYAITKEDLKAVFRLRFQVFNQELGAEHSKNQYFKIDKDKFDDICHHLMLISKDTGQIIGTYRMQTYEMAAQSCGFYSRQFFNLNNISDTILQAGVEIGRACVAEEYRNSRSLFLLWKGLANYLVSNKKQYLFGCSALLTQELKKATCAYHYFQSAQLVHPTIHVKPHSQYECEIPQDFLDEANVEIPVLFRLYLQMGAKICSLPAIDRQFKTIDFFTLFNIADLDQRYYQIFFKDATMRCK